MGLSLSGSTHTGRAMTAILAAAAPLTVGEVAAAAEIRTAHATIACSQLLQAGHLIRLHDGRYQAATAYPAMPTVKAALGRPLVASVGVILPLPPR